MDEKEDSCASLPSSSGCESCRSLQQEVNDLKKNIEKLLKDLEKCKKQLKKSEFEKYSSSKYVESLREQVSQLHKKLDTEKKRNLDQQNSTKATELKDESLHSTGFSSSCANDNSNTIDIASAIREAAEQATTNNGFVYDASTGLYFDYNTHYYYDPNTRLYYDYQKGIYYTYDTENDTYNFYSRVDLSLTNTEATEEAEEGDKTKTKRRSSEKSKKEDKKTKIDTTKDEKDKPEQIEIIDSGSEDGEIIDDDDDVGDDGSDDVDNEDDVSENEEEKEEEFPPCIRAIIMESDKMTVGSLNIITCMGVTFGRIEGSGNFIRISDVEISKEHAKIHYDNDSNQYFVTDLGSQNGTFINGTRLSESKVSNEPRQLCHGEQLRLGGTTFLIHIHPGIETCDDCEPGQVQAQLKKEVENEVQIFNKEKSNNSDALRRKELRRIKKRYMLQNSEHEVNEEIASNTEGKYKDRAQVRRKKVGSDVPTDKLDDAPSSVSRPINSDNKGRLMLEKMGWSDGEGLGKTNAGRVEPVTVALRETGCGLGFGTLQTIDAVSKTSKAIIWRKARERYENATETTLQSADKPPKNEPVDIFADT